jgi:hypothetical protein
MLEDLSNRIFGNHSNGRLLKFLNVDGSNSHCLRKWKDIDDGGFDESGRYFFDRLGVHLPSDTKYALSSHDMYVIPETGTIFACLYGRFTFLARCDFRRNGAQNGDHWRTAETLDGHVDIRVLGCNWAILSQFVDEEMANLEWAYALAVACKT